MSVLAFDMGGTRLKGGIVSSEDGTTSEFESRDVAGELDRALSEMAELGHEFLSKRSCSGVGLCVPGLVDENGVVVSLPGKFQGIEGFDLTGFLRRQFELEDCVVVNDAVAYGSGEAAFGAGRDFRTVVVVTIGTGVGVTVLQGGVPLTEGVFGAGILGGQIPISEAVEGRTDTSGRPDTIEALCRAERIVDYTAGAYSTVEEVYAGYAGGESAALQGLDTYRGHLVRALVALAHAHAPEAIVVGGGPLAPGTPILAGVEEAINARLFGTYRVVIRPAELGDRAALAGLARVIGDA